MYKTQSPDTTVEAERAQFDLLRRASINKRAERMSSMSRFVIEASRRAIQKAHPEWSEREVLRFWIEQHYGTDAATAFRDKMTTCMSSSDILVTLAPVAAALSELNVPFYICGSVASSVLGEPRSTLNIDLVADLQESQVETFISLLGERFYADAAPACEAIRRRSSFNLIHQETFLKVDIFLPKKRRFDDEQLRRREMHILEEGSPQYPVATPEDVLLSKMEWFRLGGETSDRQWRDILGVLKVNCFDIDIGYLEHWAKDLRVDDLLVRAFDESGITR